MTVHADLSPDRRLQAAGGQARALFAELMVNMSTRAKPDGGALQSVVERFVSSAVEEAPTQEATRTRSSPRGWTRSGSWSAASTSPPSSGRTGRPRDRRRRAAGQRGALAAGRIHDQDRCPRRARRADDHRRRQLVRPPQADGALRAHGRLSADADLPGRDGQPLQAGQHHVARRPTTSSCCASSTTPCRARRPASGWLLGGTPEFLLDTRRGLYSYQALQSRLEENTFATAGLVDYSGPGAPPGQPVARRTSTSCWSTCATSTPAATEVPAPRRGAPAFMEHCSARIGDAYFRTPRNTIKEFVNFLAVLRAEPRHVVVRPRWAPSRSSRRATRTSPRFRTRTSRARSDDSAGLGRPARRRR